MPILSVSDVLPCRPSRILVAGTSGSGKSTMARRIGERLDVPYVEIDSLFHGPGWVPRPSFVADVQRFIAGPAWVIEWQYKQVREQLAERADLLVWLDLPRWRVMRQVTARTVRRRLARQVLWNGNLEPPLRTLLTDPDHIIRWAWRTHGASSDAVTTLAVRLPELPIVRIRSRREAHRFLTTRLTGKPPAA
ncbi:AAA family ATPase [Actinoplanes sp. NPDC049596]|uniref:AAA family ATPase n=1 Tax=unclassified Actinoplanes TaxID=2626549 RepID=UPI00344ADE23